MSPAARARRNSGSRKRSRRFNTVIMAEKWETAETGSFGRFDLGYNKGLNEPLLGGSQVSKARPGAPFGYFRWLNCNNYSLNTGLLAG
jgi:hypothetical protein